MKLHSLRIEGFRKHLDTTITFSKGTFLIGGNNLGKSSVLKAIDYLLSDTKKIPEPEFFCHFNESTSENQQIVNKIVFTAEFRDLPDESNTWRGFKGRIFRYDNSDFPTESGLCIFFRKTFEIGSNYEVEMKELSKTLKPDFVHGKTIQEYTELGLSSDILSEVYPEEEPSKTINKTLFNRLLEYDELYDFNEGSEIWVKNPGGIPGNVLSYLPKFLLIPAEDKASELSSSSGALVKTLNSLFEDVRDRSENYRQVQHYLTLLQHELDPDDSGSEFGQMMEGLNKILGDVFPQTKLLARANLSEADKVIKPNFDVEMGSNAKTPIENQGTGVIRSAVFAMLRYRSIRENRGTRPLIIGFEEPEIYLHPNAANQMRDTIYELANSASNQIICTTHSPFMIDLSRNSSQILNHLNTVKIDYTVPGQVLELEKVYAKPFNISKAFLDLQAEDKGYVKMLLKVDEIVSKAFFVQNVLIVEGDTEEIVLIETISRMPEAVKRNVLHNWTIIKARGKATIISLVKYLKSMGIHPTVIHDQDQGKENAEKFNQPILEAVGDSTKRVMLVNCIEDVLGYTPPSSEKPYKAYKYINETWGNKWDSITTSWKEIVEGIFSESLELSGEVPTSIAIQSDTHVRKGIMKVVAPESKTTETKL